jgi:hypothetical protein
MRNHAWVTGRSLDPITAIERGANNGSSGWWCVMRVRRYQNRARSLVAPMRPGRAAALRRICAAAGADERLAWRGFSLRRSAADCRPLRAAPALQWQSPAVRRVIGYCSGRLHMDDFKPINDVSTQATGGQAQALETPEHLARRFFTLAMLGVLGYVAAIVALLSNGN